jgi:hypothetical protein
MDLYRGTSTDESASLKIAPHAILASEKPRPVKDAKKVRR